MVGSAACAVHRTVKLVRRTGMFEKVKQFSLKQGLLLALGASLVMPAVAIDRYTGIVDGNIDSDLKEFIEHVAPGAPLPQEGEFVHIPPAIDALENEDIHPKLKEAIRRGHDLFVNTQQLRGENVFNSMNCVSCHLGEDRKSTRLNSSHVAISYA